MSDNWKITKDPDGAGWTLTNNPCGEIELPKEYVGRNQLDVAAIDKGMPPYNCTIGYHDWQWYTGFHVEKYWYCERCDLKDFKRPPPPAKKK